MLRMKRAGLLILCLGLLSAVPACHFEAQFSTGGDAKKKEPKPKKSKKKGAAESPKPTEAQSGGATADGSTADGSTAEKPKPKPKPTEPKPAKPQPPQAEPEVDRIPLPGNLVFEEGNVSVQTAAGAEQILTQLKAFLDQNPQVTLLRIEGHSDNVGTPELTLRVSGERALAIKQALVQRGVAPERLVAVGFGDTKPVADNGTPEGRAQNRRTEFKIAKLNGKNYLGNDPLGGGQEFK